MWHFAKQINIALTYALLYSLNYLIDSARVTSRSGKAILIVVCTAEQWPWCRQNKSI